MVAAHLNTTSDMQCRVSFIVFLFEANYAAVFYYISNEKQRDSAYLRQGTAYQGRHLANQ